MRLQHIHQQVVVWQSSIFQTTTTLVDAGNAIILVDPNWLPDEIAEIQQWISTKHRGKEIFLLITHSDFDHIIGCGAFPEAKIIASKGVHQREDKEKKLQEIAEFDAQNYIQRPYPITYPFVDFIIREDGFSMTIGQLEVLFYLAPGHVSDSILCVIPALQSTVFDDRHGLWIAGDYFSDIEIPWIDDDLTSYISTVDKSLKILQSYPEISTLIPGHGKPASNRDEIFLRMQRDKEYLQILEKMMECKTEILGQSQIEEQLKAYAFPNQMIAIHRHNLKKIFKTKSEIRET